MVTEEWPNDQAVSRANKIIVEVQLRKFGRFAENYSKKLQSFEETLAGERKLFGCDPINVKFTRVEKAKVFELVDTDNKILNKVVVVLASLCLEARERKEEAFGKFYNALLQFGEECDNNEEQKPLHLTIGTYLPLFQELLCFINRCHQVVIEILKQLSAIYTTSEKNQTINPSNVHFEDMMDHLGDVLTILVTLDILIGGIENVREGWSLYKRLIKTVQLNISQEKLSTFENITKELEINLFSGKIFHNGLDKTLEIIPMIKNSKLADELQLYLKNMLTKLENKDLDADQMINQEEMLWVKVTSLFVFHCHLFGLQDKKLLKHMWEVSKKHLCVTLFKNVIWFPDDFLFHHLSHIFKSDDKKQKQTIATLRLDMLNQKDSTLASDTQKFTQETCLWIINLSTTILTEEKSNIPSEELKHKCKIFLSGVKLASDISRTLKTVLNLHAALAKPMTKAVVLNLCKMAELLKGIQLVYQRHYFIIAESMNHVVQYLTYQAAAVITNAKNRILADKSYTKRHLDTLSALVLAQKVILGPVTLDRCLIARLALSIARGNSGKVLKDDEIEHIYWNLQQLNKLCLVQKTVAQSCDASFLYFQRVLLPIYFQNTFKSKMPRLKLPYMLNCMSDSMDFLGGYSDAVKAYETDVLSKLKKEAIMPLCESVETDLRLQVHSHLRQDEKTNNPLLSADSGKDLLNLIDLPPVKLFSRYLNFRSYVEVYLDKTFYNLTTVALHDWRSYGEMRSLGKTKYNLNFVPNHLPYQTLEHGLDILEIMRNIHIFVSKYLYNLNNQIFVEQSSQNKHLNTINIRHVSNSIRMHGTGIMNTTVNFTYQFLRKKFYIFSQFLFDEQIKSRLTKDILYFKEHKTQMDQKYSYERADKFNKGIRKLGLSSEGLSYLDQFRILISHIGNAMGYVRMIRSGGMHCCSDSLNFIPDLEDIFDYGAACRAEGLPASTCEAADSLNHVIRDLTQNFAEGTQYFKLLVEVFANNFRNPKNNHLQNFYIIVPPLTINFVEYMIAAKDKMNRRNKTGATFTDDGFAMGLAYVLKLLNQNKQFDSLHWFQSVRDKYNREKSPLIKSGPVDENLRTTNLLTAKRLDTYQQEFDLLYFSLSSAKIFFQKQVSGK